jgi:hypothetical protein
MRRARRSSHTAEASTPRRSPCDTHGRRSGGRREPCRSGGRTEAFSDTRCRIAGSRERSGLGAVRGAFVQTGAKLRSACLWAICVPTPTGRRWHDRRRARWRIRTASDGRRLVGAAHRRSDRSVSRAAPPPRARLLERSIDPVLVRQWLARPRRHDPAHRALLRAPAYRDREPRKRERRLKRIGPRARNSKVGEEAQP